ncbi:hypothetical protein QUB30_19325 [Microcoleus sp. BROC3]
MKNIFLNIPLEVVDRANGFILSTISNRTFKIALIPVKYRLTA